MDDYYKLAETMYNYTHSEYIRLNKSLTAVKERKELILLLAMLLKEICENENVSVDDIKCIGGGFTSSVYQIGDKVLKVGDDRYSLNIPNNPYIIKPLLRRSFEFLDKYNGRLVREPLFVELTERVELVSEDEVTEEDLYKIYKALRDMNIEWVDISARNVGRLIKDNEIHWHEPLDPDNNATLLNGDAGDITLKKGDLVIIDSDFIYETDKTPDFRPFSEDDQWSFYDTLLKFRERYAREKKLTKNNKQKKSFLIDLRTLFRRNPDKEEDQGMKI